MANNSPVRRSPARPIPDRIPSTTSLLTDMVIAQGVLGGTAQAVGGPFDKQGSVGQHFNADGKIGGMVQENLANKKQ